jgi:hypothetical protein
LIRKTAATTRASRKIRKNHLTSFLNIPAITREKYGVVNYKNLISRRENQGEALSEAPFGNSAGGDPAAPCFT